MWGIAAFLCFIVLNWMSVRLNNLKMSPSAGQFQQLCDIFKLKQSIDLQENIQC